MLRRILTTKLYQRVSQYLGSQRNCDRGNCKCARYFPAHLQPKRIYRLSLETRSYISTGLLIGTIDHGWWIGVFSELWSLRSMGGFRMCEFCMMHTGMQDLFICSKEAEVKSFFKLQETKIRISIESIQIFFFFFNAICWIFDSNAKVIGKKSL